MMGKEMWFQKASKTNTVFYKKPYGVQTYLFPELVGNELTGRTVFCK